MVRVELARTRLRARDRDGLDLDQGLRIGQTGHDHDTDRRGASRRSPCLLKDAERRTDVVPLHDVDSPFDDVVQRCAGGGKHRLEILEDLLRLGREIVAADDLSVRGDRVLAADVDGSRVAFDDDGLHALGIDMRDCRLHGRSLFSTRAGPIGSI